MAKCRCTASVAAVALFIGLSSAGAQTIGNCRVFPANNVWNVRVDTLPVHARSAAYVNSIGLTSTAHADFGSGLWAGAPIGIPYVTVPGTQPKVPITFDYSDESDPGPYPIPPTAPIEGGSSSGGDRHVLVIDQDNCILYEVFAAYPQSDGSWTGGSGAIFNLNSNVLRPATWTSADAAGLPIFPGLARYDEVAAGQILHALRFTAPRTQAAYVWPGRHLASSITDQNYPPMGQRFRLKASFNISTFPPQTKIILQALKTYGMILADNGSAWYVSGAPDERWNNDDLHQFGQLTGADFEAVDESSLMVDPNSGQAVTQGGTTNPPLLSIQKTHSGSFRQGQVNSIYAITVSNGAAAGPTSGTVVVTDTIPSGLTLVSMSGTGWTCPATAANNCSRSDVLNAGSSYPPIQVTVNVASNAPSQVTNVAGVSGGGSASASASDATIVSASGASMTISQNAAGCFTALVQGESTHATTWTINPQAGKLYVVALWLGIMPRSVAGAADQIDIACYTPASSGTIPATVTLTATSASDAGLSASIQLDGHTGKPPQ